MGQRNNVAVSSILLLHCYTDTLLHLNIKTWKIGL